MLLIGINNYLSFLVMVSCPSIIKTVVFTCLYLGVGVADQLGQHVQLSNPFIREFLQNRDRWATVLCVENHTFLLGHIFNNQISFSV